MAHDTKNKDHIQDGDISSCVWQLSFSIPTLRFPEQIFFPGWTRFPAPSSASLTFPVCRAINTSTALQYWGIKRGHASQVPLSHTLTPHHCDYAWSGQSTAAEWSTLKCRLDKGSDEGWDTKRPHPNQHSLRMFPPIFPCVYTGAAWNPYPATSC